MGMYTGLRGEVTLLPKIAELLREWYDDDIITDQMALIYDYNVWEYVASNFPNQTVHDFARMTRSAHIPNGSICYMPEDWEWQREIINNKLTFCCSLKNYNGEISVFIEKVLPVIAVSWDLEERYEQDEDSTFHKY